MNSRKYRAETREGESSNSLITSITCLMRLSPDPIRVCCASSPHIVSSDNGLRWIPGRLKASRNAKESEK